MLSLVLPERCIHCGRPTVAAERLAFRPPTDSASLKKYLCAVCHAEFDRMPIPDPALLMDRAMPLTSIECITSVRAQVYFIKDSLIQSIVHSFKYGEMPRLVRAAGASVALKALACKNEIDAIIPVPLHRTREAERGFNQSEELAAGIGAGFKIPLLSHKVIRRVRPTRSQAQLTVAERLENVQGAFRRTKRADELLRGKRLLLVDDVLTTGSTISAVASELQLAQPASIQVLVFAVAAA